MRSNTSVVTPEEIFYKLKQFLVNEFPDEDINELIGFTTGLVCAPFSVYSEEYMTSVFLGDVSFSSEIKRAEYISITKLLFNIIKYIITTKSSNYSTMVIDELGNLVDFQNSSTNVRNDFIHGFVIAINKSMYDYQFFSKHKLNPKISRFCILVQALDMKRGEDYWKEWELAFGEEKSEIEKQNFRKDYEDVQKIDLYSEIDEIILELYSISHKLEVRANKVGRNDLCSCGSGKKYKKCCANNGPTIH